MEIIFKIIITIATPFVLIASIRYMLEGFVKFPENAFISAITHPAWFVFLIPILLMAYLDYSRSWMSPLPWVEFNRSLNRHGLFDALLGTTFVIIADLWFIWIPANIWIMFHPEADKQKRIMARIINLVAGFLLMTPGNPVYKFLGGY
jgi:hypothetical protein